MHDGHGSDIFLTLQNCTSAFRTKCKPWVSNLVLAVPAAYAGMELLGKLLAAPKHVQQLVTNPLPHAPEIERKADTNSGSAQVNAGIHPPNLQPMAPAKGAVISVPIEAVDSVLVVGSRVALNKNSTTSKTKAIIFGATHKANADGIEETKSLPGGHGVMLFPKGNFEVVMVNETSVSLKPVAAFWQTIALVAKTSKTTGDEDVVAQTAALSEAYTSGAHCFATGAHCLQHSPNTPQPKHSTAQTLHTPQLKTCTTCTQLGVLVAALKGGLPVELEQFEFIKTTTIDVGLGPYKSLPSWQLHRPR